MIHPAFSSDRIIQILHTPSCEIYEIYKNTDTYIQYTYGTSVHFWHNICAWSPGSLPFVSQMQGRLKSRQTSKELIDLFKPTTSRNGKDFESDKAIQEEPMPGNQFKSSRSKMLHNIGMPQSSLRTPGALGTLPNPWMHKTNRKWAPLVIMPEPTWATSKHSKQPKAIIAYHSYHYHS